MPFLFQVSEEPYCGMMQVEGAEPRPALEPKQCIPIRSHQLWMEQSQSAEVISALQLPEGCKTLPTFLQLLGAACVLLTVSAVG